MTSLPHSAGSLSELNRCRTDIEFDIRNLKVVLNTEHLAARSVGLFHKELLTSLVAYKRQRASPGLCHPNRG